MDRVKKGQMNISYKRNWPSKKKWRKFVMVTSRKNGQRGKKNYRINNTSKYLFILIATLNNTLVAYVMLAKKLL